jgi:putative peptide zinc metalloprotease protein
MQYNHLDIVDLDGSMYTVKNTINKKYIKMGGREVKFLLESIGCVQDDFHFADMEELNQTEKELLTQKFDEWGFTGENVEGVNSEKFDITKIKICEIDPCRFLQRMPKFVKELFSIKGAVLLGVLTVVAFTLLFGHPDELYRATVDSLHFSILQYIIFYFMMIVTTMLHEWGHAICCHRHGGKISSMGMMLFFLIPCFFCDVSDIYMFKDRKKGFSVAVSGIAVNYGLGTISCILFFLLNRMGIYAPIFMFYYFANIGFVAFNMIPFVKLDGYWVATALFNVDNLMDKSILIFLTGILHPTELESVQCNPMKKTMLFLYGLISLAFRPIFWVISVYSLCEFLSDRGMDWMCGVVVGFVFTVVLKDVMNLLKRYVEMYRNQKQRVLSML